MTYELFETVYVPKKNIKGVIIDTCKDRNGNTLYIVESNVHGEVDDSEELFGGCWPTYELTADEIQRIE